MQLAVVNLKGGTGKTTTAVYLALCLVREGRTLLVDADPQASALSWSEVASEGAGDFPVTVVSLPVRDLHKRLPALASDYAHLVVDTPPGDQAIVRSALLSVQQAIVAISPSLMDLDRLRPTLELIAEIEPIRSLRTAVLLTRVRNRTKSIRAAQQVLNDLGLYLLQTVISLREEYARAFGSVPTDLGEYPAVLEELRHEP